MKQRGEELVEDPCQRTCGMQEAMEGPAQRMSAVERQSIVMVSSRNAVARLQELRESKAATVWIVVSRHRRWTFCAPRAAIGDVRLTLGSDLPGLTVEPGGCMAGVDHLGIGTRDSGPSRLSL